MAFDSLNFVQGEGISVHTGPNPDEPDTIDVEIANTIGSLLDAKGDLLTATDLDVPARLAVGADGEVLTADSSADTGLVWAAAAGDPAMATSWWAPLADSSGALVVDADGALIPTLLTI